VGIIGVAQEHGAADAVNRAARIDPVTRSVGDRHSVAGNAAYSFNEIRAALCDFARRGGPAPDEYTSLQCLMDRIAVSRANGTISDAMNDSLWDSIGEAGSPQTLMGFIYRKPHGYHGDFEIIDKFYRNWVNPQPHLARWDSWIQSLDATQAVRNRKAFFTNLVCSLDSSAAPQILIVGSGPCRDLREAFEMDPHAFSATCVDTDPRANAYARELLNGYGDRVAFVEKNALRINFNEEFDVAWSAGLFDYLDDRLFVVALRRMYRAVRPPGSAIIGNLSLFNSSRAAMEWANWRLFHRSPEQLLQLVHDAQLSNAGIDISSEPLGVNLFITIVKQQGDTGC